MTTSCSRRSLIEIVVARVVGEVVVARLRSGLFSRCPGLDVDLLALDQHLLDLAVGDLVEEVGERDLTDWWSSNP